ASPHRQHSSIERKTAAALIAMKSLALKTLKHQSLNPSRETLTSLSRAQSCPLPKCSSRGEQRLFSSSPRAVEKRMLGDLPMNEGFYLTCPQPSHVGLDFPSSVLWLAEMWACGW
ncbi:mCG144531, partial [Mus musculus]